MIALGVISLKLTVAIQGRSSSAYTYAERRLFRVICYFICSFKVIILTHMLSSKGLSI